MTTTISITRQWQIYLPQAIRNAIGLKHPTTASITTTKDKIIITPQKESDILKLAGKFHHLYKKKPINIERLRDYIDYSNL